MKALRHRLVLLAAAGGMISCSNTIPANKDLLQTVYHYTCTGTGFNDIKKIYTPGNTADAPFFASATLQQVKTGIDCLVYRTVTDNAGGNTKYVFRLDSISLSITSGEQLLNTRQLQLELRRPVIVVVSPDGKMDYLKTDTSISTGAAAILKECISHFQFVQPLVPGHNEWQTAEANYNGLFTAHYKLMARANQQKIYEKINAGYQHLKKSQPNQRLIPGGRTRIVCDDMGGIHSVEGNETQVCLLGKDTISAGATTTKIVWQSASPATGKDIDQLRLLEKLPGYVLSTTLNEDLTSDDINRTAFRQTLGSDNWASLWPQMGTAVTSERKERLILQCRALAWLSPADCRTMGRILQTAPYNSNAYTIIAAALAQAGTALSLNLLTEAIHNRRLEDSVLVDLLPVLAVAANPTDQAITEVKALLEYTGSPVAVRYTAQLALGGMALHVRKTDTARAEAITRFIVQQLSLQRDTMQALLVLGNTGSVSILPLVSRYALDTKLPEQLRVGAINALRFIQQRQADVLLLTMQHNKNRGLAAAAKDVIRFRKAYFENEG